MLTRYEEINLDLILERAGLYRNEFETSEYDALLYDNEIRTKLEELLSFDKDIVEDIHNISKNESTTDYLTVHKKYVETILKIKSKIQDPSYKKIISNNKIDYKVERIMREADINYVLEKFFSDEPMTDELLEVASFDYYLLFLNNTIIKEYTKELPRTIELAYKNRLEEIDKYIPKNK